MPLDRKRLEKVVDLGNGTTRARCPACAESGGDRKGEHLRIYADGRFGCCVYPQDREHRRRIFALTGERVPPRVKVRVAPRAAGAVRADILGRLGRLFPSPGTVPDGSDASFQVGLGSAAVGTLGTGGTKSGDAPQESGGELGTPGTPILNSNHDRELSAEQVGTLGTGSANSKHDTAMEAELPFTELGTAGTTFENSRVCVERVPSVEGGKEKKHVSALKGFGEGVPSVPKVEGAGKQPEAAVKPVRMPHFTPGGTLVIPFDSPERYHWWKGGQSVAATVAELKGKAPVPGAGETENGKEEYGDGV